VALDTLNSITFASYQGVSRAYHPYLGSEIPTRTRGDDSPLPSNELQPSHPQLFLQHERTVNEILALFMSHIHPTPASSSSPSPSSSSTNFQLIINNALNIYKKRTKKDLREHPLAAQLQTCDSYSAIVAILQQQVQGLDQSRSANERWTKWLDPTVNVLYTFSDILGAGVSLVCTTFAFLKSALIFLWQLFSPASVIFAGIGVLLSVHILNIFARAIVTHNISDG
jgi:hypothetical protein